MRKLILNLAISLDGFIEGPNGEYDWCFTDQDYGLNDFIQQTDAIFYGSKSYELFYNYQPEQFASPEEEAMFQYINEKKKYVFSGTQSSFEGNPVVIGENWKEEVIKIKSQPGKNIWLYGGAKLTTSLVNEGLVDGFQLALHPVALGSGTPLFGSMKERLGLKLVRCTPYDTGLVVMYYEVG